MYIPGQIAPRIQVYKKYLHWALKSVNITYIGLYAIWRFPQIGEPNQNTIVLIMETPKNRTPYGSLDYQMYIPGSREFLMKKKECPCMG